MGRRWINQPSTLQPLHKLNGLNVLADTNGKDATPSTVQIFFLPGSVISMLVPRLSLSKGWQTQSPQKELP